MSVVKGWCPSAYKPMMSGDGLLVRVKPRLGLLTQSQSIALSELSDRFGNGQIDLTSRANFQIRGVSEQDFPKLRDQLLEAQLIDADPILEERRNIIVSPLWTPSDLTEQFYTALLGCLTELPEMPAKIGYAIDTGATPMLKDASADFRIEAGADHPFILRADGATHGVPVTPDTVAEAVTTMVEWFVASNGNAVGRMSRLLSGDIQQPSEWTALPSGASKSQLNPGSTNEGVVFGVPFGRFEAKQLIELMKKSCATSLHATPWRMVLLKSAVHAEVPGFLSEPAHVLNVAACPGAPSCAAATVATYPIARALAHRIDGSLHVSGCSKGCARNATSSVTLIGRDGLFDIVLDGAADSVASHAGLSETQVLEMFA
ncbi:MAG: cobalamin biosynthesis protein CobG [Boseongicola sp.]|nr:cobalamin biosynthesis protein CobG [Boseongicola sp.]MDD9977496.1 cobalamin biosynthesis protein CobG [Boseongicola sp.]